MQGQRGAGNFFTGSVDLNQGSATNSTDVNPATAWSSLLTPVESRLSSTMLPSAEGNYTYNDTFGHSGRGFSRWGLGESSSTANVQSQGIDDGLKIENGRSSLACPGCDARLEERQLEPSVLRESVSSGIISNHATGRPPVMQSSSSNHVPLNLNLNAGLTGSDGDGAQGIRLGAYHNLHRLSGPSAEPNVSSDCVGTSSGNSGFFLENENESGSSLGNWGSSSKRKALAGTSGECHPGGSSSSIQPAESFPQHGAFSFFSASGSLSISSPPVISPSISPPEHLNARNDIGTRGVPSGVFSPLQVTGIAESSSRNFGVRGNAGHTESVRFSLPSAGNTIRHSNVFSSHQTSRPLSLSDLDSRMTPGATSLNNPPNPSHSMNISDFSRNVLPSPWNRSLNSRASGSSSSPLVSGDRGVSLREEAHMRNTSGNSTEHPMFIPVTEMRNIVQDPNNWNLSTRNTSTSVSMASSSRIGHNSTWIPHHNSLTQNQQTTSEYTPWTLFPSVDSESGGQRGYFSPLHSDPSSSEETVMSSGASSHIHRRPHPRFDLLMEVPSDDINGWRALAAGIEGRQRLVSEDYMMFDPFINGVAEVHDRHRDMRLDVDNMSYEELLALEESIGNVSTGLSEETILKSMPQRKYLSIMEGSASNMEPCCICQEEYATGDDIGSLDCSHDFHVNCIKQWLTHKNLCPICKMTALGT
ncbi:E3 ubiquitin-protein ligase MBR2-like isoform X2 [Diospyros lotus]|uniref:E3 ubiquitin-protein ligase MBR2-like isoform X2 n=1 Tax=Diospyros lotus TaxID=55363 RepID=UPI002250D8E5|nr:E3 ubiquitin-protein ligase MBR2-like isoform X2 [Diospyros lotus]